MEMSIYGHCTFESKRIAMEGRVLEQEKKRSNWMRVDYIRSLCLGARTCITAILFRVIGSFQLQNGMLNVFSKQYKFEHYCSRKLQGMFLRFQTPDDQMPNEKKFSLKI
jgi:hypothetical protein